MQNLDSHILLIHSQEMGIANICTPLQLGSRMIDTCGPGQHLHPGPCTLCLSTVEMARIGASFADNDAALSNHKAQENV